MQFAKVLAYSLVVLLGACGSSDDSVDRGGVVLQKYSPEAGCTEDNVKLWAYESMLDYYLFYDQVPSVNPVTYDSAAELVEDIRVLPYDRFSRVAITSDDVEVFVEGKTFGIGAFWQWDSDDRLRVAGVYTDSPLGRAGVARGDRLVSINSVPIENLTDEMYQQFVGTRDNPQSATWTFEDAATLVQAAFNVTPALFDINTVMHSETIEHDEYSGNIGYLVLDRFLGTSESELDAAISKFREDNIQELILDLRYNGGGLVSVATKLVSQIAGPSTDGELLMEYRHNNKYSEFDFSIDFESVDTQLNLNRLVVLTSNYTASASEIVINALSPYIEVVTVGGRTIGKPYISFGNDLCGQRLHALQAEGFNADNVSVYNGIEPSCNSSDDLGRDFGYVMEGTGTEGMLDDAINYLVHGSCDTPVLASTPSLQDDSPQETRLGSFARALPGGGIRTDQH